MARSRLLASALVVTALAGAALTGCGGDGSGDGDGEGVEAGADGVDLGDDDLSDVTLTGLGDDRAEVDLAALAGTPVVVNFFASTCAPCVREMPALEEVHQAAGDEVAFVGVAVNDRVEDAMELVERTGVTYILATDPSGEFFTASGATLLPTTLLLDADGRVVFRFTGEVTAEELAEKLAEEAGVEVVLS